MYEVWDPSGNGDLKRGIYKQATNWLGVRMERL